MTHSHVNARFYLSSLNRFQPSSTPGAGSLSLPGVYGLALHLLWNLLECLTFSGSGCLKSPPFVFQWKSFVLRGWHMERFCDERLTLGRLVWWEADTRTTLWWEADTWKTFMTRSCHIEDFFHERLTYGRFFVMRGWYMGDTCDERLTHTNAVTNLVMFMVMVNWSYKMASIYFEWKTPLFLHLTRGRMRNLTKNHIQPTEI